VHDIAHRELCTLLFSSSAELALQLSPAGIIRAASAGARAVLGMAPRDLVGRLVYDCVAEEDRDRLREALTRLDASETAALTWTWPTRVPVEARATAWPDAEAEDVAAVLVLRATNDGGLRLTSAPELASLFAHELNQPVTSLLATAQACHRLAREDAQQALHAALDQLVVQAERTGDLVRRLRDFAKGVRTTRSALDMHEVIQDALADFADALRRQGVAADLRLAAQPSTVEANRTLMGQVLGNLIRNGVEAMQDTPKQRRRLTISTANRGGALEIEIMDRGSGISVEGVNDLFQPFVSTKPQGTGLGLALTRAIVQAHGGRVWWKDRHGRGATFVISLPLTVKVS
jgi:signal transduction histidine kinase